MSAALWVVDPSMTHAEEQGVEEVLRGWPGEFRVFRPVLRPGDGPGPGTGYGMDGLVLMGSAASVHENSGWLEQLAAWLDPMLAGSVRVPVLGICFGHQLIAHRAGGEVGFLDDARTKRVGVEESEIEGSRLLPGSHRLEVVVSHREEVTRPPERYRVVARRRQVPVDGLEHEELSVFSFQFHPEARTDFARRAGIDPGALGPRLRADSQRLLGAFRGLVLGSGLTFQQ